MTRIFHKPQNFYEIFILVKKNTSKKYIFQFLK